MLQSRRIGEFRNGNGGFGENMGHLGKTTSLHGKRLIWVPLGLKFDAAPFANLENFPSKLESLAQIKMVETNILHH